MARAYKIVKKVGRVNYEVKMSDKKKRKRVFHVNLLQKWHTPMGAFVALEDDSTDWDSEVPAYDSRAGKVDDQVPNVSDRLTPGQKAELGKVMECFPEVLCNEPQQDSSDRTAH